MKIQISFRKKSNTYQFWEKTNLKIQISFEF